jgi:hypothetical protein
MWTDSRPPLGTPGINIEDADGCQSRDRISLHVCPDTKDIIWTLVCKTAAEKRFFYGFIIFVCLHAVPPVTSVLHWWDLRDIP